MNGTWPFSCTRFVHSVAWGGEACSGVSRPVSEPMTQVCHDGEVLEGWGGGRGGVTLF